jgi:hypothetical protein
MYWLARCVLRFNRIRRDSSRIYLLNQSGQHPSNFMKTRVKCGVLFVGEQSKIAGEEKEVFQLARRTGRDIKKLAELRPARPGASFRNVGWYRSRCSSHLTGNSESFVLGKDHCCGVDTQDQSMAFLPNLELLKVLHHAPPSSSFFCIYLQLITNNCQLLGAARAN